MDSCFVLPGTHQRCAARICNVGPSPRANKLQNDPFNILTISSPVLLTHLRPETRVAIATSCVWEHKLRRIKFLAIESLRISLKFNISAAQDRGPGSFNVVASRVKACEYLSLGLHAGNHSRPTPLTIISFLLLL